MDAWNTIRLPFGSRPIFRGELLVLGSVYLDMSVSASWELDRIFVQPFNEPEEPKNWSQDIQLAILVYQGDASNKNWITWYVQESQTVMKCPQRMNHEIKDQKISTGIHMDCPIGCLCQPLKNMCVIYIYIYIYPPWKDPISHLRKRNIIDSKVPAGTRGYVSSLEGIVHIHS